MLFHGASFDEIVLHHAGGGTLRHVGGHRNRRPTVEPEANFTIPARTPFTLTGSGDRPNGDALTFDGKNSI